MSLDDLDLILRKDPIISTWLAQSLVREPLRVEADYRVHASTHLRLGETPQYVDRLFKWVSGANKGTFIGAVLGEYGGGKTSFLVDIWAESSERQVFAVPPFEWTEFEQIIEGIAGWLTYVLNGSNPELAHEAEQLHGAFRAHTVDTLARDVIQESGGDYDAAARTIESLVESDRINLKSMSAGRLLDYLAQATSIVQRAGYVGLLVLLDEPEVAARSLGVYAVQLFLFDLANELLLRQGNYGVFVSMPRNFYATAASQFPALTARLEGRGCFPNLTELYGPDFAQNLWERYVQSFQLDALADQIVQPLTLQAIGQVGAVERGDLSYGPRTVVSAFSRMVAEWRRTRRAYTPQQFVEDMLAQEIMVADGFRSRVQAVLRAPDIDKNNASAVTLLAAFPAGLRLETLDELGFTEVLRPLARANGPVYRSVATMGLRALAPSSGLDRDPLREQIEEIDSEFAQDRRAFANALSAFCDDFLPTIFRPREGQQLEGWQPLEAIRPFFADAALGTYIGAFPQTMRSYPQRAAIVVAMSMDASLRSLPPLPALGDAGTGRYDLQFGFALRWNREQKPLPYRGKIIVTEGKPICLACAFDLTDGTIEQTRLAELVGAERLTPLWVLNLIACMKRSPLGKENDGFWQSLRDDLIRKLAGRFFDSRLADEFTDQAQATFGERPSGLGRELLGAVSLLALQHRYPDYVTLIRQPHWQNRVDTYISALRSVDVPVAVRRGQEDWKPEDQIVTRVLGTNRMNLSGGAYTGYESLLTIATQSRGAPLEIRFRTHPLEDEIRGLICAQEPAAGRRFKYDGKECWHITLDELMPAITHKGYTLEELGRIIEIGKARDSYREGKLGNERVLFCVPFDPEELRTQLRSKLGDLVKEIGEYKRLPGYVSDFDDQQMAQGIDTLADDADYGRLLHRLEGEFEANHRQLPAHFAQINGRFDRVRSAAARLQSLIGGAREVNPSAVPAAKSAWRKALELYIVPNLQHEGEDIRSALKRLQAAVAAGVSRYTGVASRSSAESLALVLEGYSAVNDLDANLKPLEDRIGQWLMRVSELQQWFTLLRSTSDLLYERLLALINDESHRAKGEELLFIFDGISTHIEEHLQRRNIMGLPAFPQFTKDLEDLEMRRQEYLTTLKSNFDLHKEHVQALLEQANLDAHVNITFNPAAVSACYAQLYEDGAHAIQQKGCDQILREIADQQRDLRYAQDILKVVSAPEAESLNERLELTRAETQALRERSTSAWLKELIGAWTEANIEPITKTIETGFSAIRESRRRIAALCQPDVPQDGHAARLHAVLPAAGQVDLKELILEMMDEVRDPSVALESNLDALAELFRRNCVQISVSRRTR